MKIAIGSDHRGYAVKQRLITVLRQLEHQVVDLGVASADVNVDYPDFAFEVGKLVGAQQADRGILICGTGIGMCIAANKVPGVRAAPCHDSVTVEMSRRHNDANVLCLSADLLGAELIERMVRIWLTTEFDAGRHQRRIDKIAHYEASEKK
jgi:ribose 5-phosphate isomerase B